MKLDYVTLYKSESWGTAGAFGLQIMVAGSSLPDLESDAIRDAAYKATALVTAEVRAAVLAVDPEAQARAVRERVSLLTLFGDQAFYVETVPNGYCSDWCCRHLPWFVVTTRVGRFKIGWRKSVIHLEWTETTGTQTANALFLTEDVTKGERYIHAWSLEKAREYIQAVLNSTRSGD